MLFGTVQTQTLSEGLHIINPLIDLVTYDVRRQRVDVTAAQGSESGAPAVGADGGVRLDRVDATMPFRLQPEFAGRVHQRMGPNYLFLMVAPVARSALRDAISQFPAESVATTNRDAVAARATELFASKLIGELAESGFTEQESAGALHRLADPAAPGRTAGPHPAGQCRRSGRRRSTWNASAPSP